MMISWCALAEPSICQRSTTRILSWPSVKQCASTATGSPAMRLAANRPPSTTGSSASMTARTLPSAMAAVPSDFGLELATGFPAQHQGRERRQTEGDRLNAAVRTHGRGFHAAQVAPAGAAIIPGIRIDDLAPDAARRHADEKIGAWHRREVTHHQQRRAASGRLSQEGDDAHLGVVDIHPLESVRREIDLVQRGLAPIYAIQIADQPLDTGVPGQI